MSVGKEVMDGEHGPDKQLHTEPSENAELESRLSAVSGHPLLEHAETSLREHIALVPPKFKRQFLKKIEESIGLFAKNEALAAGHVDGVLFELSRMARVIEQDLEHLNFDEEVRGDVAYLGYTEKETDFSGKNLKPKQGSISLDVPLTRTTPNEGNTERKAYAYETKSYQRKVFGAAAADRNQILKYQGAIEQGLLAGATIEVKGRIDPKFLKWLIGGSIGEKGATQNIEIIYALDLPSGAEYRFVLNGVESGQGLRFKNEHGTYTREDQEVINGIFKSVIDQSVIDIIASGDVSEPSEELKPLLDDPYDKIKTLRQYREYAAGRTAAMHATFRRKSAQEAVNTKNERSSIEIVSHPSEEQHQVVGRVFDAFQESLKHDPELQPMRERYEISDPDMRQGIIQEALAIIRKVGAFEEERAAATEQLERPMYRGKPEGVALRADSIVFDAVHIVLRRKDGGAVRSYDAPERFDAVTLDNVMDYLSGQERTYRTCEIFDPATGQTESLVSDGGAEAERRIEKLKAKIPAENAQRLEEAYLKAVANHEEQEAVLNAKEDKTPEEIRELRRLKGKSTTELRQHQNLEIAIKKRKDDLRSLSAELQRIEKSLPRASAEERLELTERLRVTREFLKTRSEESRQLNAADKEVIDELRKKFIGKKVWEKLEVRTLSDTTRNLVKFIYIINAEGGARLCEEKLKGNTRTRATHSEVAQGRNVYGAGEIIFEKIAGKWSVVEVNNGSGHYKPSRLTLPYVKQVIGEKLDLTACMMRDTLLRGVTMSEFKELLDASS